MAERLPLYATASRGTEALLADELTELGGARVRQQRGGVAFSANLHEAMHVLVHSRIAMRLLYPLGEFDAPGADGLYEAASNVPWEEWISEKNTFAIEATLKDTEHTHSGFVALKLKDGLVDRLRRVRGSRPDVDTHTPDITIVAHLSKTKLSLSLDLCGEPLFKRGYRMKSTPAPLKETLAAAMLRACAYDGSEPLADPLCGSGTIVIEAGHIAARRAPGLKRPFAVERWPTLGAQAGEILAEVKRAAAGQVRPPPEPLYARDRDPDALAAVKRNVTTAGLGTAVRIEEADATKSPPPESAAGLLCTNPPYGDRLTAGGQKGMKTFYFQLGEAMKQQWTGWRMAWLSGNPAFESAFHHRPTKRIELFNGPIACTLLQYGAPTPAARGE